MVKLTVILGRFMAFLCVFRLVFTCFHGFHELFRALEGIEVGRGTMVRTLEAARWHCSSSRSPPLRPRV